MKIKNHPRMERRLLAKIKIQGKIQVNQLIDWLKDKYDYTYNPNTQNFEVWIADKDVLEKTWIDGMLGIKYIEEREEYVPFFDREEIKKARRS